MADIYTIIVYSMGLIGYQVTLTNDTFLDYQGRRTYTRLIDSASKVLRPSGPNKIRLLTSKVIFNAIQEGVVYPNSSMQWEINSLSFVENFLPLTLTVLG